jgi:hypothetical protein
MGLKWLWFSYQNFHLLIGRWFLLFLGEFIMNANARSLSTNSIKHSLVSLADKWRKVPVKVRTFIQRLTTLEMGKKCRQNLEHNISQSPCILPLVRLYHCLALPLKRTEITSIIRSYQTCQWYASKHRFVWTLIGVSMSFCRLLPRRIDPKSVLNMCTTHNQVLW